MSTTSDQVPRSKSEYAKYDRIIFHVDVNSAFLSWSAVERLKEDPDSVDLRTIPSIICGDVESRHGIVTAKSIPAKKYGIQTAEPVVSALKKCPDLVLVKGDFNVYREYSDAFIGILRKYAPVLQQVSIDEAYMDMTGTEDFYRHLATPEYPWPICVAKTIQDEIYTFLGFTVNVGISCNKLLAKMASDFTKPNRIHTLFPNQIEEKMWPLPVGELHGCGKQTAAALNRLGIFTIGEAAHMDKKLLMTHLGEKAGEYIYNSANGISTSPVSEDHEGVKSVSNETTLREDLTAANYAERAGGIIRVLSDSVSTRMRRKGVYGSTVSLSVKSSEFARHSRQLKLDDSSNNSEQIYQSAKKLLDQFCIGPDGFLTKGGRIRLIGVGMNNLDDGSYRQMSLFDLMGSEATKNVEEQSVPDAKVKKHKLTSRDDSRNIAANNHDPESVFSDKDRLKAAADETLASLHPQEAPEVNASRIKKQQSLDAALESIRNRFGKDAISRASTMNRKLDRLKDEDS